MLNNRNLLAVALVLLICAAGQVRADSIQFARSASNSLTPFLIVGEGGLLATNTRQGIQAAQALLATGAETELLKNIVREKRPDKQLKDQFSQRACVRGVCNGDFACRLQAELGGSCLRCCVGDRLVTGQSPCASLARRCCRRRARLLHSKEVYESRPGLTPAGLGFFRKF